MLSRQVWPSRPWDGTRAWKRSLSKQCDALIEMAAARLAMAESEKLGEHIAPEEIELQTWFLKTTEDPRKTAHDLFRSFDVQTRGAEGRESLTRKYRGSRPGIQVAEPGTKPTDST